MKQRFIYCMLFVLLVLGNISAQVQIQNGGMELWQGFNLQRPVNWGTREQALGLKSNKWDFEEMMPDNVHSGITSIKLYSDTTYLSSKRLWAGMIVYGKARYINNELIASGLPIYGRPTTMSLFIKIYHPIADTAILRLVLTRWNLVRRSEDTLACETRSIFPEAKVTNEFVQFIDTINYLMDGQADTAQVIISGGRHGNPLLRGNTVWIDDLSFDFPSDQIVHPDIDDDIFLYPNPATTTINIAANADLLGYKVIFLDVSGIKIKEVTLDEGATTIDVANMHDGSYCYAVLDRDGMTVHEGNINIMKDE